MATLALRPYTRVVGPGDWNQLMNGKRNRHRMTGVRLFFIVLLITTSATAATAARVALGWDPNDPAPDGYRVFVREAEEAYLYDRPDWEGQASTCEITGLNEQTIYCFTVRAFVGDRESEDAAEVCRIPSGSDYENDGLPDAWEYRFGLDFLADDTVEDADGDGINNRDEYRSGLEPDFPGEGTAPEAPVLLSPAADAVEDHQPLLVVDDYADADGDAHIATQWQIYDALTNTCLLDVMTDTDRLTQLRVPLLLLAGDGRYHWRARFLDSGGHASEWSSESSFTTRPAVDDTDGNGIPDHQEVERFGIDDHRSATLDSTPPDFTTLEIPLDGPVVDLERMTLADPSAFEKDESTPSPLPASVAFYKLILEEPGQWAQVALHLSDPTPTGSIWLRYGSAGGWQECGDSADLSADRRSVTLDIKDGGIGDGDGAVNGIILDAVGLQLTATDDLAAPADPDDGNAEANDPGTAPSAPQDTVAGGGGGGCFIGTVIGKR